MIEKGQPKKCKNDTIKIVLYMIFMTALFTFYGRNVETVKSVDNYHAYFNEIIIDQLSTVPLFENGNENMKIEYLFIVYNYGYSIF